MRHRVQEDAPGAPDAASEDAAATTPDAASEAAAATAPDTGSEGAAAAAPDKALAVPRDGAVAIVAGQPKPPTRRTSNAAP